MSAKNHEKKKMIFQISLMQYVNCVQNFVVCCFMYIKQQAKHLILYLDFELVISGDLQINHEAIKQWMKVGRQVQKRLKS